MVCINDPHLDEGILDGRGKDMRHLLDWMFEGRALVGMGGKSI
jgi:hypothetical protein